MAIKITYKDNVTETDGKTATLKCDGKIMNSDVVIEYVGEEETTIPTDLTGYRVDVPSGWSASSGYGDFDVYNALTYYDYTTNYINGYFGIGKFVSFDGEWMQGTISNVANSCSSHADSGGYPPFTNFSPTQSFTLYIKGGTDTTNQQLIQWFVDNGATFTIIHDTGGSN